MNNTESHFTKQITMVHNRVVALFFVWKKLNNAQNKALFEIIKISIHFVIFINILNFTIVIYKI